MFGPWFGTKQEFLTFVVSLPRLGLLFTNTIHEDQINFLDLTIYKNKMNKLEYKTYFKSISRYQYVSYLSTHPIHTKKGMIKGELIRYKRNSSTELTFNSSKNDFQLRLFMMNYPLDFMDKEFNKVHWNTSINNEQRKKIIFPLVVPAQTFRTNTDVSMLYSNTLQTIPNARSIVIQWDDSIKLKESRQYTLCLQLGISVFAHR